MLFYIIIIDQEAFFGDTNACYKTYRCIYMFQRGVIDFSSKDRPELPIYNSD